jgi:hypothetical protein
MSDFVKRRTDWLNGVIDDPNLGKLTYRLAVKIAHYVNAEKGYAFPGTRRLADELKYDRRHIQRGLNELVDAGYLDRKRGQSGARKYSSRYWLVFPDRRHSGASADTQQAPGMSHYRRQGSRTTGANVAPYKMSEHRTEHRSRAAAAAKPDRSSSRRQGFTPAKAKRAPQRLIPEDWRLTPEHYAIAAKLASWDKPRTDKERQKFINWALDRQITRSDWSDGSAADLWQRWCQWGRKIDQDDAAAAARQHNDLKPGVQRALAGVQSWLRKQEEGDK